MLDSVLLFVPRPQPDVGNMDYTLSIDPFGLFLVAILMIPIAIASFISYIEFIREFYTPYVQKIAKWLKRKPGKKK